MTIFEFRGYSCKRKRIISTLGLLVCIRDCRENPFCGVITEQKDCNEKPDPASAEGMPKKISCTEKLLLYFKINPTDVWKIRRIFRFR